MAILQYVLSINGQQQQVARGYSYIDSLPIVRLEPTRPHKSKQTQLACPTYYTASNRLLNEDLTNF